MLYSGIEKLLGVKQGGDVYDRKHQTDATAALPVLLTNLPTPRVDALMAHPGGLGFHGSTRRGLNSLRTRTSTARSTATYCRELCFDVKASSLWSEEEKGFLADVCDVREAEHHVPSEDVVVELGGCE